MCVAFSGGGDSLALLHMAQAWGQRLGRPITALTVDHGLNPLSAAWTTAAGAAAARLGVDWRALVWSGEKPAQGLPAAARAARHALLASAARELGACVILMGHTADDVAESALIRAGTPGHGRLRPWAPSPAWPEGRGVFLLRPLLAARRSDLRAWLSALGLSWLEDPANADPRFARSRARAQLAGDQAMGDGLALPGDSPCVKRLAQTVEATADGRLVLPREGLAAAPQAAVRRVVSAALVCAGGGVKPPRGVRLDRMISAVDSGEMWVSTLAGARVVTRGGDGAIKFERDAGERARGGLAAFTLSAGEVGVFDGRYEVRALNVPLQVVGLVGCLRRLDRANRMRLAPIPALNRGALPAVIDADGVVRLPAPFGDGPAVARALVGQRFAAACGLVGRELDLAASHDMAL